MVRKSIAVFTLLAIVSLLFIPAVAAAPQFEESLGQPQTITTDAAHQTSPIFYFAEGTTRPGFVTYFCIQNPGDDDAHVNIVYMRGDGTSVEQDVFVGKQSRATVAPVDVLGSGDDPSYDFSTVVTNMDGNGIIVERPMYFDYKGEWDGGHDVVGLSAPSQVFFFAEGTCRPGFDAFFCVQNPGQDEAQVTATYMKGDGTTATQAVAVAPFSRATISPRGVLGTGDDPAHDFSAKVECTNGQLIVVERPMYFNYQDKWTGGSDVLGTTAPDNIFYFAEGTCRPGFDTYLTVQNPGDQAADVTASYLTGDGRNVKQDVRVGPLSRATLWPRDVLGTGQDAAHDFASVVECTNGQKIVVERPMYFDYNGTWTGGHDVVGISDDSAEVYYFAEGSCRPGFNPYFCIFSPGDQDVDVTLTYFKGDGSQASEEVRVPASSRVTVDPTETLGAGDGPQYDFSTKVECLQGAPIVVERPMYFDYAGEWTGGHDVVGLPGVGDITPGTTTVTVGAVTITYQGSFYWVDVDMTKGKSHYDIGHDYGEAIDKMLGWDYVKYLTTYIGTAVVELKLHGVGPEKLAWRVGSLWDKVPQDYKDEVDGLLWGYGLSLTAFIYPLQVLPDAFRYTHCSAFAAFGGSSSTGSTIAFRNLDWFGGLFHEGLKLQAVTRFHFSDKNAYYFGALGHLGCITGVIDRPAVPDGGVMGAILDSDVKEAGWTEFGTDGARSYNMDLRYQLEHAANKEAIADYMSRQKYTYSHLIWLVDKTDAKILENNVSGKGDTPRRVLRTAASEANPGFNPGIWWGYPNLIGAVNCFVLKGQVNNYSQGQYPTENTKRWQLMRSEIDKRFTAEKGYKLTPQDVQDIMTSYWGDAPRGFDGSGDIFNADTLQSFLYVPAQRVLRVYFQATDGSAPKVPKFITIPLN